MNYSTKPSAAGPNRLLDETGASRKGTLSASFISVIVSLDIERPMAWAVALVARRARIVALLSSMSEAASSPVSSLASFLAWKTWSTAIECSAEAVCPAGRVCTSSECRCGSARLGQMARSCLPSDSCGWAEMCVHRLIQRRQVLVSFFFSAVNRCESS